MTDPTPDAPRTAPAPTPASIDARPRDPRQARQGIDEALTRDRGRLQGLWSRWNAQPKDPRAADAFAAALQASVASRRARAARLPGSSVQPGLPIAVEADRIVELIRRHQVVVIAGETGSGKTTQLPKLCLAAGRGAAGMIGCTQPRRIAARAVARRVADELQVPLGGIVGFQVRFNDNVSDETAIKFMTDGILLAEMASDRWLSAYDTIIIDEAHERSLNIDFLLGYLKQLLQRRRDLKLIVTSATIDTSRFSEHFDNAPVVSVEGRGYPVEVRYRPLEGEGDDDGDRTIVDGIVGACDEIFAGRGGGTGDALIFLPGEREIRDVHQALERRKYRHTEVLPLYARLSVRDQDRVFNPGPQRRIVLATNVAETSLTVPRIHYVIDPGLARVKRYSPRQKLDRLHIEPVSQASAEQRKGRCGRIAPGICYRIYSEADFLSRSVYTDPEIRRAALSGVILRMLSLGLGGTGSRPGAERKAKDVEAASASRLIEDFPFIEMPDPRAVADGWQQLSELGAVDDRRQLTAIGRTMAKLPVDVKLARMLVAAQQHGVLHEMLAIASFLGIQDPRERPADQRAAADNAHALFADPRSEFVAILKLWEAYRQTHEDGTQSQLRKWCERHFLGFLRMREWRELHRQLKLQCEELGWKTISTQPASSSAAQEDAIAAGPHGDAGAADAQGASGRSRRRRRGAGRGDATADTTLTAQARPAARIATQASSPSTETGRPQAYVRLHRALIAGLPTQIGLRQERGLFDGPRGRKFQLFPGSSLARKPPPWLLSATLLDTEKVWALTNAAIEPEWVIDELPHLLARRHHDPRWSRGQGRVVGSEQISLFGLVLAPKRPIDYGRLYPQEARELFLRDGLVAGEINSRSRFLASNQKTLAKALDEEAKQRKAGLVVDEDWMLQWYGDRIPAEIVDARSLDAWSGRLSAAQQQALEWSREDLLVGAGSDADRFPEYLALGDARLAVQYRFEPGAADDGMTIVVPLYLLNALDPTRLSWLAPGLVADKATALIKRLPKALRRNFVPVPDVARLFAEAHDVSEPDTLSGTLARFLKRMSGVDVSAGDFDEAALEPHLRVNLRLLASEGRQVLAESRDLDDLRSRHGAQAAEAFALRAAQGMARQGVREFPETPIPESVAGVGGIPAWPALQDDGDSVSLVVHAERAAARRMHPQGVHRLLLIALQDRIRQARKQLPVQPKLALLYAAIESAAPRPGKDGDRLREDLVDGALASLLAQGGDDIRSAQAFVQRRDEIGRQLFGEAMARLRLAETVLATVADIRAILEGNLIGWARANLDDMRAQLNGLVGPGFLRDAPGTALESYPRYLKALLLRGERALRDPTRDQQRMLEIKPFADAIAQAAIDGAIDDPRWQSLRWDLEELRVSLFAQELGARGGVSAKKLATRLAALSA